MPDNEDFVPNKTYAEAVLMKQTEDGLVIPQKDDIIRSHRDDLVLHEGKLIGFPTTSIEHWEELTNIEALEEVRLKTAKKMQLNVPMKDRKGNIQALKDRFNIEEEPELVKLPDDIEIELDMEET